MGQSVIEINGKKYDATTGQMVVDSISSTPAPSQASNIDGIVTAVSTPKPATKPVAQIVPRSRDELAKERRVHDISLVHSGRTNKSKTLMRSVVKKPAGHAPNSTAYTSPVSHSTSYKSSSMSDVRLTKALSTPKNGHVSKFTIDSPHSHKVQPTVVSSLPVREPNPPQKATPPVPNKTTPATATSASSRFVDSQLAKVASEDTETPFKKKPIHKRATLKLKHNKLKSFAVSGLAALLIVGFLAYQNLPTITLALANKNAGISARIPKSIPSNFALSSNIAHSPGQVVLSFDSRVDDRSFTLTQVKADATVQTLKDTVARVTNEQYQTYEAGGITLFLSTDRADWMDGGMRYNISGTSGFSPDQIALIASSL